MIINLKSYNRKRLKYLSLTIYKYLLVKMNFKFQNNLNKDNIFLRLIKLKILDISITI